VIDELHHRLAVIHQVLAGLAPASPARQERRERGHGGAGEQLRDPRAGLAADRDRGGPAREVHAEAAGAGLGERVRVVDAQQLPEHPTMLAIARRRCGVLLARIDQGRHGSPPVRSIRMPTT
jgi:hypothetical protein